MPAPTPIFRWFDAQSRFLLGKYKGVDIYDVATENPSYLRWMLENVEDLTPADEDLIEEAWNSTANRGRGVLRYSPDEEQAIMDCAGDRDIW